MEQEESGNEVIHTDIVPSNISRKYFLEGKRSYHMKMSLDQDPFFSDPILSGLWKMGWQAATLDK